MLSLVAPIECNADKRFSNEILTLSNPDEILKTFASFFCANSSLISEISDAIFPNNFFNSPKLSSDSEFNCSTALSMLELILSKISDGLLSKISLKY